MFHSPLGASVGLVLALLPVAPLLDQKQTASAVKNVVLVHGAFADGSSWSKVIPIFEEMGCHAVAVQNPMTSLTDEVTFTKSRWQPSGARPGPGRTQGNRRQEASSTPICYGITAIWIEASADVAQEELI